MKAVRILQRSSNKVIKHGFRVHKVGKRVRRGGLGLAGAGGASLGLLGGATYVASRGRTTGIPAAYKNVAHRAFELSRFGMGSFGVPTGLRTAVEEHAPRIAKRLGHRLHTRIITGPGAARRIRAATSLATFATKHKLRTHSGRLFVAGLGLGAAGMGIERVGSYLINRGFRAHRKTSQLHHALKHGYRYPRAS